MEFFLLVRSNEISISVSFSFFFLQWFGRRNRLSIIGGGESRELSWNPIISKIVLFFSSWNFWIEGRKGRKKKKQSFSSLFANVQEFRFRSRDLNPSTYSTSLSIIDSYPPRFFPYNLYIYIYIREERRARGTEGRGI